MSLINKTQEYKEKILDRFHTPGHKGILWDDDITEIDEGNYFPNSLIKNAESGAAKFYGCKHLRFLTGGSSMGVKAAILAVDGDIIAGSNSHRSVFEGVRLAKVKVNLVENTVLNGLPQPLSPNQIEEAIKNFRKAKAVVITSPDYFGQVCSQDVYNVVKKHGKILIADSAHGAHFSFRPDLFPPSFSKIADFCNMSAHKTLCAMTMSAYLCVNNESYINKVNQALDDLGTTSPLYPLLASLENAITIGYVHKDGYDRLKVFKERLSGKIKLLQNQDFTRIVVDAAEIKLSGKQLFDKLFERKIAAEMYNDRYVVFITTPLDDDERLLRLETALTDIANEKIKGKG